MRVDVKTPTEKPITEVIDAMSAHWQMCQHLQRAHMVEELWGWSQAEFAQQDVAVVQAGIDVHSCMCV